MCETLNILMTDDKVSVIWPFWPEVDIFKGELHAPLDLFTLWRWVPQDVKFLNGQWSVVSHPPLFNRYLSALMYLDCKHDIDLSRTFVQPELHVSNHLPAM